MAIQGKPATSATSYQKQALVHYGCVTKVSLPVLRQKIQRSQYFPEKTPQLPNRQIA